MGEMQNSDSQSKKRSSSRALCVTALAILALLLSIVSCALHIYVIRELQHQVAVENGSARNQSACLQGLPGCDDRNGSLQAPPGSNGTSAVENGSAHNQSVCQQGLPGCDDRNGSLQAPPGSNGTSSKEPGPSKEPIDIMSAFRAILTEQNVTGAGSAYIRWGRTVCPASAMLVYSGIAAGSVSGGGAEKLCLPTTPQWGAYVHGTETDQVRASILGAEYQSFSTDIFSKANANGASLHNHDVPCAVCHSPHATQLMIPALMDCPNTWTKEYNGYLMAEKISHPGSSSFDCVDAAPEIVQGGELDHLYAANFFFVEARCGALPCANYINGRELTCVVCTK